MFISRAAYMQLGEIMKAELIVDGQKIPLNAFVQKILAGGVVGMVETLDSVEMPWKTIELKIENDKK
jgi:hypothetical protein